MLRLLLLALLLAPPVIAKQGEVETYIAETGGTLSIDERGHVIAVELDNPKIGDEIREGYARHIQDWRFEPVVIDGKPARVTGHMRLSLVAFRQDGVDGLRLGFRNVSFYDPPGWEGQPDDIRFEGKPARPVFPEKAARAGIGASVQLMVKVGKDGAVAEAATQDVWLTGEKVGSDARRRGLVEQFAASSERAAARWRFANAPEGKLLQVPVRYVFPDVDIRSWVRSRPEVVAVPQWVAEATQDSVLRAGAPGEPISDRFRLLTKLGEGAPEAEGG